MSALEERPACETLGRHHLDTMAEALVELHSVPAEALARVRPIERYEQTTYQSPRWTTKQGCDPWADVMSIVGALDS